MKLLVLDRDGVVNEDSPDYIRSADDWRPLPGSLEAISALCASGWTVAVATNQSGVGRKYLDEPALERIHEKMRTAVAERGGEIDQIVYCPHLPEAGCPCRKPRPGLLNQLASIYGIPAAAMTVVGDSQRDITAAQAVNARAILVRTGNGKKAEASVGPGVTVADDLAAVAQLLAVEAAS